MTEAGGEVMRPEPGRPVPALSARLRALAILHPFPSLLNAVLVAAIVLIAGGTAQVALVLAVAMLAIQCSIGVTNDVVDLSSDRLGRPGKPLVRGDLGRSTAVGLAGALGVTGILVAATRGPVVLALLAAMYGCGLAYDLGLKRLGLGWLAYAVAFPLLPAYAWFGATGTWPPRYEVLLPIAALAGPALAMANGLVDVDRDRAAGERTLVVRLGGVPALVLMAGTLVVIHAAAWVTIGAAPVGALVVAAGASILGGAGIALTAQPRPELRERGWQAQTVAIAVLASAWFVAAVVEGRTSG